MDRIVQVGDVFVGIFSAREFTVTEVNPPTATLKCMRVEWEVPMTPDGRLAEVDHYRFVCSGPTPEQPTPVTEADDLLPGDRVRFKYNKKAGTVVRKTDAPWPGEDHTGVYLIQWDHRADTIPECRVNLVVLYAPRATDAPLPAQKAIDEVDALREAIKAEVERLQAELRKLNGVKNKLKGVELR